MTAAACRWTKISAKIVKNGLATEAELADDERAADPAVHLQAGLLDRREGHQRLRPRRRHGRGQDQYREDRRHRSSCARSRARARPSSIKIPLTLAIVSALIVECAGERFAIPQISVVELVRATADRRAQGREDQRTRRSCACATGCCRWSRCARCCELTDGEEANEHDTFIVVTQVGTYNFGIIVDRVFDTEEIVVKPVAPILRHIPMFSGNTILGDGSVIMILDPNGIAEASGQLGMLGRRSRAMRRSAKSRAHDERAGPAAAVPHRRRAAEGGAARAGRAPGGDRAQDHRASNGRWVVQYRGQLMPLVPMSPTRTMASDEGRQPVLVFADRDHAMGLMVDEIVDIVEAKLQRRTGRRAAGPHRQRDHRRPGDRDRRCRLLPHPGFQGLVRLAAAGCRRDRQAPPRAAGR